MAPDNPDTVGVHLLFGRSNQANRHGVQPMSAFRVRRHDHIRLRPDASRVLLKPFLPGEEVFPDGRSRIESVLQRILDLPEVEVADTLATALGRFAGRHRDIERTLDRHLNLVTDRAEIGVGISRDRQLLIGAYFSHEYSVEAAALGNPSVVVSPDQTRLAPGEVRFVMSLRAIGEGHVSSIEFRTGVVRPDGSIHIDEPTTPIESGARVPGSYDRAFFQTKLRDLGAYTDSAAAILDDLNRHFTEAELEWAMRRHEADTETDPTSRDLAHLLHWLASSNYHVEFSAGSEMSQRVIFPAGPNESGGMEDVRLVRFVHDDGEVVYFGTYTAFDGHQILPQLIETSDFCRFRTATLSGESAQNKGMALFPRKLDGDFVALGRQDNVNNFLMRSDDVRIWRETDKLQEPKRPWELTQLGNCGSPLETEAGWLVITHGVGPFRQYSLGAVLLDLDDPCRVIGHLSEPLLEPLASEREGYVPNVVYSCGSMIVGDQLVLPYGYADVGASIATVEVAELLDCLVNPPV